jgi:ribosomal-protein-serine acetyltransferase
MREGTGLGCAITVDRDLAGGIGLHKIDSINRSAEIGYWLVEGFVGRGVMSRSTQALTSFAFEELAMHRVVIRAATGNARSRAIPMRLGYTHEGTERGSQVLNGESIDIEAYSMLSTEWAPSGLS